MINQITSIKKTKINHNYKYKDKIKDGTKWKTSAKYSFMKVFWY